MKKQLILDFHICYYTNFQLLAHYATVSGWTGNQNLIFGFLLISWKGLKANRRRQFIIVLSNFLPYLMIFQSSAAPNRALHFEKSSNMEKIWQKMKKSIVLLAFNSFLHGTAGTQIPVFEYPNPGSGTCSITSCCLSETTLFRHFTAVCFRGEFQEVFFCSET